MNTIKKYLYIALGIVCVGMAYVGFVLPGIPFSIFLVVAAWAFAKSSPRLHTWLYSHPWFGDFLTNWTEYKVFPIKAKYAMLIVMSSSLGFLWLSTGNAPAVLWSGACMLLVAVWAWRFPSSLEEYARRKHDGRKIGWLK